MNQQIKALTNIFFVILIIVFLSFLYFGLINRNPVSNADYNIPIAQSIVSGDFLHIDSMNPYMYFPGSSHFILSAFLFFHLPINLFGLLSWVCLLFACKKLGDTFHLQSPMSFLYASSVCTTISVIRTIADRSINNWLCFWFISSIILLEKSERNWKYYILIGLSLGMLIGTKYSGPLFFIAIVPVYWKKFINNIEPYRFSVTSMLFTITGLFWYIRNFVLKGSPYYPANLPFFKGYPNFTQQDWMLWKIPFVYPAGILPILNSFFSEYMIWAFAGIFLFGYVIYCIYKKISIDKKILTVIYLSVTTGLACLLLPVTPAYKIELFHIISDMRYLYIFVIMTILATFLLADKYNFQLPIAVASLLNAIPLFSFIPYQPKIFVLCSLLWLFYFFTFEYFKQRQLLGESSDNKSSHDKKINR